MYNLKQINNFKSFTLMKTCKLKPTGYKGLELTIYCDDNVTIAKEIKGYKAIEKFLKEHILK